MFNQAHLNPSGVPLPQKLSTRLRLIGILRLIPRMFALIAVQRQTAASKSTSPSSSGQQGSLGGDPIFTSLIRFSTFAQTPNFSALTGHLLEELEGGVTGVTGDGTYGFGLGVTGPGQ